MKTISTALMDLLLTKQFVFADLYTFTLTSGEALRYTTADIDISDGSGNTFVSSGPFFDKLSTHKGFHAKTGLDVDTWEVVIAPRMSDPVTDTAYPDMIGDVPWLQAAVAGILDGAVAQVDRQYFPAWPQPPWGLNNPFPPAASQYILSKLFYGRVGQIAFTRTAATVTLNSYLNILQSTMMPANVYGSTCLHNLFDAGCTLNAASAAIGATISTQPPYNSQTLQVSGSIALPAPLSFALGHIVMTSGKASGLQKRILSWDRANTITLDYPFPFQVNEGDTCTLYPGCDKSMTMCSAFGNLINYRGYPYIPVPELAF